MAESRIWALLGLVLVVVAALLIVPETLAALGPEGEGGLGLVIYGTGVVVATAVTIAIILPSLLRSRAA
jgi:hypothetical protein